MTNRGHPILRPGPPILRPHTETSDQWPTIDMRKRWWGWETRIWTSPTGGLYSGRTHHWRRRTQEAAIEAARRWAAKELARERRDEWHRVV